ncbi:dnaJ homolog subfamily C member 11-like [Porites lutea]|uniref:dnaJ homolog subfamily C member 11-like n=1 Tax=Porites lutea TaxID=51062 RepID=UPI003CC68EC1
MAESEEAEVDYYAVLNVSKEPNDDELKAASRCMCTSYQLANIKTREKEVLSNPEVRSICNVYGQKGLDAGWEVTERRRAPAEAPLTHTDTPTLLLL